MKDPSNLNDCGVSTIIHLLYCLLMILTVLFLYRSEKKRSGSPWPVDGGWIRVS